MDAPPAPKAQGVFTKTPFSNLLVYAMDRQLTGTMELTSPDGEVVVVSFHSGAPVKAQLTQPLYYLGDILVELGTITEEQHQATLAQKETSAQLYGELLVEAGTITEEQLLEGLGAQLARKIEHVFSMSPDTAFSYYDAWDALSEYGGPELPQIDPLPAMWAGIRANPPWEHVHEALTRVGNAGVKLSANAVTERFNFGKAERAALDLLRAKPHRMFELTQAKVLGPTAAQLLMYCLLITKQVELVEMAPSMRPPGGSAPPPSVRPGMSRPPGAPSSPPMQAAAPIQPAPAPAMIAPSPGALPLPNAGATPGAALPKTGAGTNPANTIPSATGTTNPGNTNPGLPSANAFAKVQLKQSSAGLRGITEQIATSPNDVRLATPGPMPPISQPKVPAAKPATTTASAGAIPVAPPSAPSAPRIPGATQSSPNIPAAAKSQPSVTVPPEKRAEYELQKKKIIDKSEKISSQNYFEMLGVKNDAKPEECQKAFFALAKEWHPDRLPSYLAEVKDQCGKVFSHMSEAHQCLTDPKKRADYMTLLKDGGATPDDQAKIQAILEATTNFSKAEFYLKKNDLVQAEQLCRKAADADPNQADYIALLAWLEAQKPANQDKDQTRARIAMLDRALKINENCERAYFYRGMLNKRMDQIVAAMKDFKAAADLNPRNLEAMRELRLYQMRKNNPGAAGGSIPPAANPSSPPRAQKPGGKKEESGGLFGKLFKK